MGIGCAGGHTRFLGRDGLLGSFAGDCEELVNGDLWEGNN